MSDAKDELIEALRACVETYKALAEDRKKRIEWLEAELARREPRGLRAYDVYDSSDGVCRHCRLPGGGHCQL